MLSLCVYSDLYGLGPIGKQKSVRSVVTGILAGWVTCLRARDWDDHRHKTSVFSVVCAL